MNEVNEVCSWQRHEVLKHIHININMIPVEENWLHIKNEFHEACSNLNNNSFIDNLMTFRNLGLFKLLLDKQYNGLAGQSARLFRMYICYCRA